MRLLGITDLHNDQAALERILAEAGPADAVLLGGDITNFGCPAEAEAAIRLARRAATTVLAVAGNCDSAEIDARLIELDVSLAGRGLLLGKVGLHGLSAMPPWRSDMYQFSEEELAEMLQAGYDQIAAAQLHVVLSHPPPRGGSLDRTVQGQNVGSTALSRFVERTQPSLVICGHIHEARGIQHLGQTIVVNCGMGAAGFYALADVDEEVTVELCRA